jgi:hypothetical protein
VPDAGWLTPSPRPFRKEVNNIIVKTNPLESQKESEFRNKLLNAGSKREIMKGMAKSDE